MIKERIVPMKDQNGNQCVKLLIAIEFLINPLQLSVHDSGNMLMLQFRKMCEIMESIKIGKRWC